MYQKTTLSNGLRVITVPMPQVKSATALVMVEAGSRYETQKINGLSHFLEHMIFKGTKKRPSSLAISSLIDGIGGQFNAFTSKEYTGFYVKAESRHLNLILDVLSDMLLNSLYDPKELDKERGVIIEEINMYEDQPQARVSELFEELLYGKQPLAWRISGEKKNILDITHKNMTDYVKNMYHSKAIVVGLAGDLSCHPELVSGSPANAGSHTREMPDQVRHDNLVHKYFGNLSSGNENKYLPVKEKQVKPQNLIYYKKTDQAHLCLGVRAYDMNHPDRYPLAVLGTILGGNMSSRLFIEVRERRGLAYYVHADAEEFHDCGYFVASAGLNLNNLDEAIKVILDQFDKIKNILVKDEELRRAKDHARGRMVLGLEDSYRMASFYTTQELLRREIEKPEEVLAKIEAVTTEDVQRVAKDIFVNQKLNLAIVGPFKKEWKKLSF